VLAVNLTITVDDSLLALYIDGVRVPQFKLPNADKWGAVDVIEISATTRVIAVSGKDVGRVIACILAEVSGDRLVTDTSWKCTTRAPSTWMKPDYDDSHWPAAIQASTNPDRLHGKISGISSKAKWIWTANYRGRIDTFAYCRGHLSAYIFFVNLLQAAF
jgi:hypothetical protein